MKHFCLLFVALLSPLPGLAQPDHVSETDMQQAAEMSRMLHGDSLNWLVMADRFEAAGEDAEQLQWEAQAWIGRDLRRLWLKTEGEKDRQAGHGAEMEWQLLYSRALAPFWDLQWGLRHDSGETQSLNHLVLGVQGLAPYWFELDAAAFLSAEGTLSSRVEVEYELRFTQRLILQPRIELDYVFSDEPQSGIRRGLEASVGLRLRYELVRELAPYVGLEWWRAAGQRSRGFAGNSEPDEDLRVVAGLRFWY